MRRITHSNNPIPEREIAVVGKTVNVYIHTDIVSENIETEEGNRTEYSAVEYFARLPYTPKFELTDAIVAEIMAKDTEVEAKKVRAIRNQLLEASDCEVLPDRLAKSSSAFKAWSDYRQSLRDITEQEGFPWDIVWPEKPSKE